ncbi:YkvI family membrane protein [Corynebacterium ureicelerivorans]|uniref:Membrane protein n=1 Tax=Corynebacterium ureicelerivorans TaxID=401472 RepID=A0A077HJZ9_9CORY|nr:membrane protein [Corynebacterium ureicelerivorans]AIL96786.1 membrane protein [Corynebacterium ureicelerivorans]
MGKTFKVALALVGLTVGAGFASGQEVIQYFLSFGYWGIVGAAIAGITIAVFSGWVYQLGSYYLADDHSAVFKSVSRPWIAKYMDITTMFTLFCIGFVMVAGAGANLEQQFGLPTWVGSAIMVVLLLLSGLLDVDKLTSVISFITPLLIICLLAAFVITLTDMPDNVGRINEIAQTNPHASGTFDNWLITALNYATLVMIMDTSMMLVFAGSHMNPAQAGKGGLLGGIMFAVLLLILTFVLFMNMEHVMGSDLPLLKVFDNMHPTVGVFVSIVIYLMIYNTAVGLFYALSRRLSHDKPGKFRPYYAVVVLIGFALSFIGFADLVGWVYPVLGYLGLVLAIVMGVAWFRDRENIQDETGRRERLAELAETQLNPASDDLTRAERAEVDELASNSHVDDQELWQSVQEEVAADLHADSSSEFDLKDVPALNPESKAYDGAPATPGDSIHWESYEEMYKTGEFPAVEPDNK